MFRYPSELFLIPQETDQFRNTFTHTDTITHISTKAKQNAGQTPEAYVASGTLDIASISHGKAEPAMWRECCTLFHSCICWLLVKATAWKEKLRWRCNSCNSAWLPTDKWTVCQPDFMYKCEWKIPICTVE